MNQDKIIKNLNDSLDEKIDKSKSFEDQIESLKKLESLKEYWFMEDFDDKEIILALNKIGEKLFE